MQDDREIIGSLAGGQAEHERTVGQKTRRVVMASLGVMREQKAGRKRIRALALAAILILIFVVGPAVWWVVDTLADEGLLGSPTWEIGIWTFLLISALLGCALLAGWLRRRS
jgi:hypothetical protein